MVRSARSFVPEDRRAPETELVLWSMRMRDTVAVVNWTRWSLFTSAYNQRIAPSASAHPELQFTYPVLPLGLLVPLTLLMASGESVTSTRSVPRACTLAREEET